jgi:glycogen operon protein
MPLTDASAIVRRARRPRAALRVERGAAAPLGATWDGRGVNFSVFSSVATSVKLCLFGPAGETRVDLPEQTDGCWHGYIAGLQPGQQYGFRVHGPWAPASGLRCNPHKLLLDPYARAIAGEARPGTSVLPYTPGSDGRTMSRVDDADSVPRSVVIDTSFDWQGDRAPHRPLDQTILYELHVKGFSAQNPGVPPALRGTYAGLGHPASIEYLVSLGVTAVELLPVHTFVSEGPLLDRGLVNYWGYSSIGFFAPHASYASSPDPEAAVREFKAMVRALHAAGIEVLLDVVYNHTAEGSELGPMYAFKGLDNATYYRLAEDPRHYEDVTGTGNTLDLRQPQVVALVMDSLRYWVEDMHVDGFRFDLAVALGRTSPGFDPRSAFFSAVHQDPVLRRIKLIAEPWDVADGGYQLGNFPWRWSEWNGRYRDTVRDYWRSQPGMRADLATRLTGSADLYQQSNREPVASINFVTIHDGFTLQDLVSYNDKHNEANGEENRDGTDDNRSWNLGAEGATDDPEVIERRERQVRNFIATLCFSRGVPMLLAGDELGRTQGGNNNAYCQDNPLSWIDWAAADPARIAFTQRAIALRQKHPLLHTATWTTRRNRPAVSVSWLTADGFEMTPDHWADENGRAFIMRIETAGARAVHEAFDIWFNASQEAVGFALPIEAQPGSPAPVLDSAVADGLTGSELAPGDDGLIQRPGLSILVVRYLQ